MSSSKRLSKWRTFAPYRLFIWKLLSVAIKLSSSSQPCNGASVIATGSLCGWNFWWIVGSGIFNQPTPTTVWAAITILVHMLTTLPVSFTLLDWILCKESGVETNSRTYPPQWALTQNEAEKVSVMGKTTARTSRQTKENLVLTPPSIISTSISSVLFTTKNQNKFYSPGKYFIEECKALWGSCNRTTIIFILLCA